MEGRSRNPIHSRVKRIVQEYRVMIRTKRGARRRYNAIIRACYRDADGGTQFGIDWPTLRSTWPERAAEIDNIRAIYPTLPE